LKKANLSGQRGSVRPSQHSAAESVRSRKWFRPR